MYLHKIDIDFIVKCYKDSTGSFCDALAFFKDTMKGEPSFVADLSYPEDNTSVSG